MYYATIKLGRRGKRKNKGGKEERWEVGEEGREKDRRERRREGRKKGGKRKKKGGRKVGYLPVRRDFISSHMQQHSHGNILLPVL